MSTVTHADIVDLLVSQCPTAPIEDLSRASKAIFLMLKVAGTAPRTTAKPAAKKARQYKEKSVADSLKLKQ